MCLHIAKNCKLVANHSMFKCGGGLNSISKIKSSIKIKKNLTIIKKMKTLPHTSGQIIHIFDIILKYFFNADKV